MDNSWQTHTRRVAHGVRKRVLELTLKNNGCYLSQTLSSADILATLYTKALNIGPSEAPFVPTLNPGVPGENGIDVEMIGAEHGVGKKLVRIGIDDTYRSGATLQYLMRKHEIDALALVKRVEEMIGEDLNISEEELASVRIEDVKSRSTEQLEAL